VIERINVASLLSTGLKKKILGKDQNLISLEEPYEVMRHLLKNHSVTGILDAGASRGHISERMLNKFPAAHVYAFEPQPMYKKRLEQYAQRENRFHPQFAALSDHEGTAELHVTESAGNTSLLNPTQTLQQIDPAGSAIKETVSVPLVTIDQWAGRNGDLAIQVMKFDIQGYELNALKGAVNTLANSTLIVYTEVWFNPVYEGGALLGDIDQFLRERGFLLYDIYKPKYNPNGLIQWANAMFVHAGRLGL
jgi:FkbM family methyltransferase